MNHKKSPRDLLVVRAHKQVRMAIAAGVLIPIAQCICVDCGATAECYEHRDYNKPLVVDPVCKGCNIRRGPGLPLPTSADGTNTKRFWMPEQISRCYENLKGGEGYSPLEYFCHAVLPMELEFGIDLRMLGQSDRLATIAERMTVRAMRGTSAFKDSWLSRATYFKEHDPWYTPFF